MKNLFQLLLALATAFALTAHADTLTPEQLSPESIMQKVYDRDDGNNAISEMEMVLIDKQGQQRTRSLKVFRRDAGANGKDTQTIMFFLSPADVKDTGFLTYDYDDSSKDDDQWLFLPALKKTKRIASSDKSSSFMGTDFTYADMTKRDVHNYNYKINKEDNVNGEKVWVIEATPANDKEREETGYTKSLLLVRQDNFVVVRGINWLDQGGKMKFMEVKKLSMIDGIWVAEESVMTTKKDKEVLHQTLIKSRNMQFNKPQSDDTYTTRRLEKGL